MPAAGLRLAGDASKALPTACDDPHPGVSGRLTRSSPAEEID